MSAWRWGINIGDLGSDPKRTIPIVASLGFSGIEFGAMSGDLEARGLSGSGRRHLRHFVESHGLTILSLTADTSDLRWTDPRAVGERVERTGHVVDLARSLSVRLVSAKVAALTHPESGEPSPVALEVLSRLGELSDSRGVTFALRPSNEKAECMARVLDAVRCPSLGLALDPAALIMSGINPLTYLARLVSQLSIVCVRDGTVGGPDRPGQEVRLGVGDVDWEGIVAVLEAAEFSGVLICRRESSLLSSSEARTFREQVATWRQR